MGIAEHASNYPDGQAERFRIGSIVANATTGALHFPSMPWCNTPLFRSLMIDSA
jgi:hypothetical protein